MHERREGRASIGGPVLLIITVLLSGAVCRRDTGREMLSEGPGSAAALSVPVPLPVDRAFDDRFAFAAGLSGTSPFYATHQEETPWKEFAALSG